MPPVEAFNWNPRRPIFRGRIGKVVPIRRKLNNFGDLLGPMIVNEIVRREGLDNSPATKNIPRLISVGSVLHFAQDGDVVWGTGVNGKFSQQPLVARQLDVRAVRGPLTRAYLQDNHVVTPAVYGDPGLLVSELWPDLKSEEDPQDVTVVMNFNDATISGVPYPILDPRKPVWHCLKTIASSSLVVGSSLHAIIVAESYGVPARLIRSNHEPAFKYSDYYAGTGRASYKVAESVEEAVKMGGESKPDWSPEALLAAFPRDLWK